MSAILDAFLRLFGHHKPTQPPAPPAPQWPKLFYVSMTVNGVVGALVTMVPDLKNQLTAKTNDNGRATFEMPVDYAGTGAAFRVEADGYETLEFRYPEPLPQGDKELPAVDLKKKNVHSSRAGVVKTFGRSWADDTGPFYPLGATLFWAPRGWKFERERVQQNLQFLAKKGTDYVRFLGEVPWQGNDIDPNWPDYEQVMGELVDYIYDVCGMRSQVTLTGGGSFDKLQLVEKWIRIAQGRNHKIQSFECSNESFQNGPDNATIDRMAGQLRAATNQLVAPSSPAGFDPNSVKALMGASSNFITAHLDRSPGDNGWRHVRQTWDFKDVNVPTDHNEPGGPASSVASYTDPLQLVMLRASGIMCGAGAFVLHNGAGVSGQPDPNRGRTPNLWEMPNIDAIMDAVRAVDSILPTTMENWTRTNDGWTSPQIPMRCSDWNDHAGPIKHYGAISGDGQFVQMPHGIKNYLTLSCMRACTYKVYNPLTLQVVAEETHNVGQQVTYPGDPNGHSAYIIVGRLQ